MSAVPDLLPTDSEIPRRVRGRGKGPRFLCRWSALRPPSSPFIPPPLCGTQSGASRRTPCRFREFRKRPVKGIVLEDLRRRRQFKPYTGKIRLPSRPLAVTELSSYPPDEAEPRDPPRIRLISGDRFFRSAADRIKQNVCVKKSHDVRGPRHDQSDPTLGIHGPGQTSPLA